ncbi:MAG: hypothetical protein U0359_12825 [Byssovorax sp.]
MNQGPYGPPGPPGFPQQGFPQQGGFPQQNFPPQGPPPKQGMSGAKIALIILAIGAVLGMGGCLTCLCVAGGAARSVSTPSTGPKMDPKVALAGSKKDYIGNWTGPGTTLSIGADGTLAFAKKSGNSSKTVNGPISGFAGDNIEVFALITITLDVTSPPRRDAKGWKMTVEGVEVTRP